MGCLCALRGPNVALDRRGDAGGQLRDVVDLCQVRGGPARKTSSSVAPCTAYGHFGMKSSHRKTIAIPPLIPYPFIPLTFRHPDTRPLVGRPRGARSAASSCPSPRRYRHAGRILVLMCVPVTHGAATAAQTVADHGLDHALAH